VSELSLFDRPEPERPPTPPRDPLAAAADLDALRPLIKACTRCGLRAGCQNVVVGEGNPHSAIMLIGEGPGADEDLQDRPFVGRAGQLLDKILAACAFERFRHVYIANIVKCRPPGNRAPTPEERAACLPNLRAQMRIIHPKIVVLMGAITRARGTWQQRDGVWYMPTFHPAALLRNPELKRPAWDDFRQVVAKYRDLVDPTHPGPAA
jgi:uracil-DNA glycosylase family 4